MLVSRPLEAKGQKGNMCWIRRSGRPVRSNSRISAVATVSSPANAASGGIAHVEWTVGNYGTGATDKNVWVDRVALSANEIYGDSDDIELTAITHTGQLAADETYAASADVRLPLGISGTYRIFVETDRSRQVYEYLFEGNNYGEAATALTITETPSADLQVDPVTAPGQGVAGQPTVLTWTVRNTGPGVTGNGTPDGTLNTWTDRLVLSTDTVNGNADDHFIADVVHTGALDPNQSYEGRYTGLLPAGVSGNYFLLVASDVGNVIYEGTGKEAEYRAKYRANPGGAFGLRGFARCRHQRTCIHPGGHGCYSAMDGGKYRQCLGPHASGCLE